MKDDHSMRKEEFFKFIANPEEALAATPSGQSGVPASANAFVHDEGLVGKVLDIETLTQADVIDIVPVQSVVVARSHIKDVVSTKSIVEQTEQNVVALSNGKGMPFGTGIAIHEHMVLTARHCLERKSIADIVVRNNFQKQSDGNVDFWTHTTVQGVVEESSELDYAIIWVTDPINNYKPLKFSPKGQHEGSSIFIHHPGGWTKQISVSVSLESDHEMLHHAGFHDSLKGSSGGVYVNADGEVFALHCLKMRGLVSAKFVKDILSSSRIFKLLYSGDGAPLSPHLTAPELKTEELEPSDFS